MVKTVGIVSLSSGTIGEDFVKHELDLGIDRLKNYGLKVKFMDHALGTLIKERKTFYRHFPIRKSI